MLPKKGRLESYQHDFSIMSRRLYQIGLLFDSDCSDVSVSGSLFQHYSREESSIYHGVTGEYDLHLLLGFHL